MRLTTETLVSEFESDNDVLAGHTDAVLGGLIADKSLHARFLNTLSMLEHMGSHKIMATQHGPGIEQPTLRHLADEARHALFFKRHADREAGRALTYESDDLLSAAAARRYFQRLEALIARTLPADAHKRATYLTMSMIVEFRAVWAYRIYHDALDRAGHPVSLKSLLAEEQSHLADMANRLEGLVELDHDRVRALCVIEQRLYQKLLAAFAGAVATLPSSIDTALMTIAQVASL